MTRPLSKLLMELYALSTLQGMFYSPTKLRRDAPQRHAPQPAASAGLDRPGPPRASAPRPRASAAAPDCPARNPRLRTSGSNRCQRDLSGRPRALSEKLRALASLCPPAARTRRGPCLPSTHPPLPPHVRAAEMGVLEENSMISAARHTPAGERNAVNGSGTPFNAPR